MSSTFRAILLNSRPSGMVELSNFKLQEIPFPALKEGEVLIRTKYLTVDPYMRGRMNDRASYIEPFQIGQPLTGEIVGEIVESKNSQYKSGETVIGFMQWADYNISDGKGLRRLDPQLAPISTALGILGMPGMTAYFGMMDIGKPKAEETVVISGAAGAVGMVAGQIAKLQGCRVVGITGSDQKGEFLKKERGFDEAINYKKSSFVQDLKAACPNGVDIYFDNVGGEITDAVLPLINKNARIVLCGQISQYNLEKPSLGPRNLWILLTKSALLKGFIVRDYAERYPEALHQLSQWLKEGKLKYSENVIEGLENAPQAMIGLFQGENLGKQLVKVS